MRRTAALIAEGVGMQNHYELLGVSRDASPRIVTIAYEGKLKALARSGLSEAERQAEQRDLERAHVTLSNPAKKAWYDKQLEEGEPAAAPAGRRGLVAAVAVVLLVVAGGAWYSLERSKARELVRLEEQRIAIAQEKIRHQAEIEKARLLDTQQAREQGYDYRRESANASRAERERRAEEYRRRYEDNAAMRDQVGARVLNTYDERERQMREDRERRLAENERRQAQAEVDRQKRFVAEREREDERIRTERHYRAQREAADVARREAVESPRRPH
jgi:hypothetical protein